MSAFDVYRLTEEHEAVREAVRTVCAGKVAPNAAAADETSQFPQASYDALRAGDFHAPHILDHTRVTIAAQAVGIAQGLPGGADDARRQYHPDLRGYQPSPAHRHRTSDAGPVMAMSERRRRTLCRL